MVHTHTTCRMKIHGELACTHNFPSASSKPKWDSFLVADAGSRTWHEVHEPCQGEERHEGEKGKGCNEDHECNESNESHEKHGGHVPAGVLLAGHVVIPQVDTKGTKGARSSDGGPRAVRHVASEDMKKGATRSNTQHRHAPSQSSNT